MKKVFFFLMIGIVTLFSISRADDKSETVTESIPDLFDRISPSVVLVSATTIDPFKLSERFTVMVGSGFIISDNGLIMTNSHLVFTSKSITVTTNPSHTYRAVLVGADPILDIAVVKISTPDRHFPAASLGDSGSLRVGDEVIAIGNPLGFEQTLVKGIISGINRILPVSPMHLKLPLIQTDAAINPGNSGGPLLTRHGQVVGVTTSLLANAENMSFAVPINIAKAILPQLIESGRVIRPWIGIRGQLVDAHELGQLFNLDLVDGFLVETVDPGSPAEECGLQGGELPITIAGDEYLFGGDIIIAINGQNISEPNRLENSLEKLGVGQKLFLEIYREGQTTEVVLDVAERPLMPEDFSNVNQLALFPQFKFKTAPASRRAW